MRVPDGAAFRRVVAAEPGDGEPLVFFRGSYTTVARAVEGLEPLPGEPEDEPPSGSGS